MNKIRFSADKIYIFTNQIETFSDTYISKKLIICIFFYLPEIRFSKNLQDKTCFVLCQY